MTPRNGHSHSGQAGGNGVPVGRIDGAPLRIRRAAAVVVGSGVAGMSAALGLDNCVLITETALGDGGSSRWAQGGIAAAVGRTDTPAAHAADTVAVAGGLADPDVARMVTTGGPRVIAELIERGADFDRAPDGTLALGREAGHSARRIVHADGDATGAEIVATLVAAIRDRRRRDGSGIDVREGTTVVDLVRAGTDVAGVLTVDVAGRIEVILSEAVVLATGGYAHCFGRTTTPREVIGSGIAVAARAGADVADMEFVQFHPTALDVPGESQLPLLTEALRGEGAVLIDETGRRFMIGVHDDAELAPRDVVARANYRQLADGHRPVLDARSAVGEAFPNRFPTVFGLAAGQGLDPRVDVLPVTPAAHYCMGGIVVDASGRTSLRGLWAVGETTSSGLHGANRLASNSLLEGLVLGRTVAADVDDGGWRTSVEDLRGELSIPVDADALVELQSGRRPENRRQRSDGSAEDLECELRRILWECAGVERTASGLRSGRDRLAGLATAAAAGVRTRTVHAIATMVIDAALARTESRGAHFRLDHPDLDPVQARRAVVRTTPVDARRLDQRVNALVPAFR